MHFQMTNKNEEFFSLFSPSEVDANLQSQKQINWNKLAVVELSDLGTTGRAADFIVKDHLPYVAHCNARTELDMNKASDRGALMKLFCIAQIIIKQLMGYNRKIEEDLKRLKGELDVYTDKYSQVSYNFVYCQNVK